MCEMKVCNKCGEKKEIDKFCKTGNKGNGRSNTCKACKNAYVKQRNESLKVGNWCVWRFDDVLARWVSTHARKPNSGRPRSIVAYSCVGVRTKDGGEFDDGEFLIILGSERERVVSPKFGNPMVVYQHESGELLSNVRAKENTVERSEQEVLGDCEFDRGEDEAERTDIFPGLLAYLPKGQVSRHAGI